MKPIFLLIVIPFLFISCQKELSAISEIRVPIINDDSMKPSCHFYPLNNWGMLAFEDKWPKLNDYDMNDLVVSYRYDIDKDKRGKVHSIACNYAIIAVGANYFNGLAVQFPFSPSLVKSVTGERITNGKIKMRSNGTEVGCAKTVIIPFDNTQTLIKSKTTSSFINVWIGQETLVSDTCQLIITFKIPVDEAIIGEAPFDPFLIANGKRSVEIHLPGHFPTEKADKRLFNQDDDNSKNGINYLSTGNLPWVLNFEEGNFKYTIEGRSLTSTYLHFAEWEESKHAKYSDWLTNESLSYVVASNIYK